MDFIATGLVDMIAGLAQAVVLFGFAFWAPPVLAAAWLSTHWLLRESAIWKDRNTDEVRQAQRDAEYAYRLAVDPPAAKELRIFGLPDWVLDRFIASRRRLHQLQYQATRMRERSVRLHADRPGGERGVFWVLGAAAIGHRMGLGSLDGVRAGGRRDVDDRVRRAELGARRGGGSRCRCREAARPRRPARARSSRAAARRRHASAGDPLPERSFAYPAAPTGRCSTGST